MKKRNGERPAGLGPCPVFDVDLVVHMNDLMVEQLVDFFDEAKVKGVSMPSQLYALHRQLERWAGEKEDV